ncbi:acyltransferase [Faecalibacterium prausnitzii]|uniref:acyltransferase n=2 Tax=Faecalibacterium prausnitzii TaxID=853 RepID=UPI0022DF85CC|nr:acyltransferase [Faecalibacterium prausnitzii]
MNLKTLKRYWMMLRLISIGGGYSRAEYLKKKHYFKSIGEHVYLQPWNFGTEPELISFGDNVHVASNVNFVNHDITCMMFNYMDKEHCYKLRQGEINIGNNVFIGAGSRILYDVTIGDNVIIGAGSLVNRSIPSGTVAAGVPCKVIGSFEDYQRKMMKEE